MHWKASEFDRAVRSGIPPLLYETDFPMPKVDFFRDAIGNKYWTGKAMVF